MPILKRTDTDLYYEISGDGPPILFIQGVGVVGECWRPQVNTLSKSFQTLLFDNRGIGKSLACDGPITIEAMADDARALMDAVGWESAHVVGHSMGGVIAQQLALDCPKRVRSLSLLCTFARGKDGARLTPWVLWMTLRTRLGTRRMRRRAFLEMLWSADDLRTVDTDELATRLAALVGRDLAVQPPILMKQVQALSRHDSSKRLSELAAITTVRFPSAISDLVGAFISPEPEPPALFQISFRPGDSFFSLRALATNASATLAVGWHHMTYVVEVVASSEPLFSVLFIEPPPPAPASVIERGITPERLRDIIKTAKLFPNLQAQNPGLLHDTERVCPACLTTNRGCEVFLDEVFSFSPDDTLVFHAILRNKTVSPVCYLPDTLGVRVGQLEFIQSITDAEGLVPPCGETSIYFAISAGVKGTPPGLSLHNKFQVIFERIGAPSNSRCPHERASNSNINPLRSPKDASLHHIP